MSVRDAQRSRVYEAESVVRRILDRADNGTGRQLELFGSRITLPTERKFASVESVQDYAGRVLALNWVRARWPEAAIPMAVRARAGTTAAHYEPDTATLAIPVHRRGTAWALRELVVLHELAHHLEPAGVDLAPHGPEFVGRYLTLVEEILGSETAFVLRTTMAENGVRLV
ncbi:TIGR04338 family metallohydrolase [Rhodococcus spelaei]|uniref:TIGR04338 family metallohydrolase n=1 Tax=Rhodococcus spelaei TaxID=2546320 RepID=A0A541B468_9NOCA|nr:TIGR04338 family metallohydrolase [Rhodococcus spelaei]TQF67098.1 TIGR04338 family metallohydrolase [Rhodococcus spelaei]